MRREAREYLVHASMAFPTDSMVPTWMSREEGADGIGHVLAWAAIEGDLRTSLLAALEMNHDEPMRSLALCNGADVEGVIAGLSVEGRPPNVAMEGRVRLFFNGIRSACGSCQRRLHPRRVHHL